MKDNFGCGEVDKVVVSKGWIVSIGSHVGDEVGVDVGITTYNQIVRAKLFTFI